jgi:hypothetical protein
MEPAAPGAATVDLRAALGAYAQQLAREQNPLLGVAASVVAALLGAFGWAVITATTGVQIGFAAVGVGFLVGYAMRHWGKPIGKPLPIVAAILSLIGCAAGNLLATLIAIGRHEGIPLSDLLPLVLNPAKAVNLFRLTFDFMDGLFYVIAIWAGYHYAFRRVTRQEVEAFAAARFPVVPVEAKPNAGSR